MIIEGIHFDGPIHLSDSDIGQIIAQANRSEWHADSPEWVKALAEIGLRGAWQDRGYFHVMATAEASSLSSNSTEKRFLVTAHIDEGLQYHLGDVRFAGDKIVPEADLRALFPMRKGELFSVALVREGIQVLTRLYRSHGYIDFTAGPDIDVDDNFRLISLVMNLDQQKQYRIGKVEIIGLHRGLEARLKAIVKPGEIYNSEAVYEFMRDHQPVLPSGFGSLSTDPLEEHRNISTGVVDLAFHFRPCP